MKWYKNLGIVLGIIFWKLAFVSVSAQPAGNVFTLKEYTANIIQFHPIAQKAELRINFAHAETLSAKGNLDPILSSDWKQKNFDHQEYYGLFNAKLRIPTPLGLDVVGGYDNNDGEYLNPERTTDPNGLWHLGVDLDVLQGLIVNERSITLKQAQVFQDLARNEKQILLNEVLYNAVTAYLQWQLYYHFNEVLQENLQISISYLDNTRGSYLGGEKTAMDTLEAFILYQDATLTLQKNQMELIKSKLYVENFLWYDNVPIALQESTIPDDNRQLFVLDTYDPMDSSLVVNNPAVEAYLNKLSILELDQKLKREKLKPKLNLTYHPLLATSENNLAPLYSIDNYTWGVSFSMPIFLRSEKAAVQQGNIKIQEIKFDLADKKNELQNKIENSQEQLKLIGEQSILLEQNVDNYRTLLGGETEKYNFGESSVFLLNKRQEKYITARLKLIDNQFQQNKELLNYLYYTNQLFSE